MGVTSSHESENQPQLFVKKLFIYPVKSCGYYEIDDSWVISNSGLQYDRVWMVVNEQKVLLTQNHDPKLCLIRPKVDLKSGTLELYCEGLDETCTVPLDFAAEENDQENCSDETESTYQVKVYSDIVTVKDCGDSAAAWIANVLDRDDVRLVRVVARKSKKKKVLTENKKVPQSGADDAQYLLVNEASVNWLHERVTESEEVTLKNLMERFRCNILMSPTAKPFEELNWTQLQIGKAKFTMDNPCERCKKICIDQDTGQKFNEPLRTLATDSKGKVVFGIYLKFVGDPDNNKVVIRVNDEITNIKS